VIFYINPKIGPKIGQKVPSKNEVKILHWLVPKYLGTPRDILGGETP